jgi:hypothetical protein
MCCMVSGRWWRRPSVEDGLGRTVGFRCGEKWPGPGSPGRKVGRVGIANEWCECDEVRVEDIRLELVMTAEDSGRVDVGAASELRKSAVSEGKRQRGDEWT